MRTILLLLPLGCAPGAPKDTSGPPNRTLALAPSTLELPPVYPGEPAIGTFTLSAEGGAVQVETVGFLNDLFGLEEDPSGESVDPGAPLAFDVSYTGNALGTFQDTLSLTSDAEVGAVLTAGLTARVDPVPEVHIQVEPTALLLLLGEPSDVVVTSVGNADLEVTDIAFSTDTQEGFGFAVASSLPLVLPPGESTRVTLTWEGPGYAGTLLLSSNDPEMPVFPVPLSAWYDADGDGSPQGMDCDDGDPARAPGLPDPPCDGVDQDCDGIDLMVSMVLGLLPAWGTGSGDANLAWGRLAEGWSTFGACPLSLVDIPEGFTLESLRESHLTALVCTDPAGNNLQYTDEEVETLDSLVEEDGVGFLATYLLAWDGVDHATISDNRALASLVGVDPEAVALGLIDGAPNRVQVLDEAHPVNAGLGTAYTLTDFNNSQDFATETWADALLPGAAIIAASDDGVTAVIAHQGGSWRGVWFTAMADYQALTPRVLYNAAVWVSAK